MDELNTLALTLATQQAAVVQALQEAVKESPTKEGVENLAIAIELFDGLFELAYAANAPVAPEPEPEPTPAAMLPSNGLRARMAAKSVK